MNVLISALSIMLLLDTCTAMIFGRILGLPKRLQKMYEEEKERSRTHQLKPIQTKLATTVASTTMTTEPTSTTIKITKTTNMEDWRRMRDEDNIDAIFDGKNNKTVAEIKQEIKDLIKRKTIRHEVYALQKAHHMHVGKIDDEGSFEEMKKKFEEMQKKKKEEIRKAQEKLEACSKGKKMSDELRKELSKYNDRTFKNCTKHKEPNYASILKRSSDQTCHYNNPVADFSCNIIPRSDMKEKRFPKSIYHYDCTGCTKCMFGQGICVQKQMPISVWEDEGDDGIGKLNLWTKKPYTINTGCQCEIPKDTTRMVKFAKVVTDVICKNIPDLCNGYKPQKIFSLL